MSAPLSNSEILRYSRHLSLPEIGLSGQQKLKNASVLLVGAGGLGSPLALYLAAAGVGHLGIVDADVVDESNLHRQVLHGTSSVGRLKTDSARDRLSEVNPFVEVTTYNEVFSSANALDIAGGYDLIIDGTDNFPTRYLSNDVAVFLGIPNIYGSIFRFEGQVTVFHAEHGPCYRCLYREPPPPGLVPSCAEGGVLGILPGVIGTLQATEAVKLLTGIGEPLIGRLLTYDALGMRFGEFRLNKDPDCPVCGSHATITELVDYQAFCGLPSHDRSGGEVSLQEEAPEPIEQIAVAAYSEMRNLGVPHVLIDVREPHEYQIANLGGTLLPLGTIEQSLGEIPRSGRVIIHCKSGSRSAAAVRYLQANGYTNVSNLAGGITAWAEEIDSAVPIY